jgi:cell wall-associated NlpC family hydrolase
MLTVTAVRTAGTGASAVTLRLGGAHSAPAPRPAAPADLRLPDAPAPAEAAPDAGPQSASAGGAVAPVPRPKHLVEATILVTSKHPLSERTMRDVRHVSGVRAASPVSAGRLRVDGHRALVLGVSPARFRPWTPKLTAHSQRLWQSIARGELTASFDMGKEAGLPLGADVPVRATKGMKATATTKLPVRVGAFASVGMAGVDAVMSSARAQQLGMKQRTGAVVSAPKADALTVRRAIRDVVGSNAHVSLLREIVIIRDAGEFLTRAQINTVLQSAAHEVGKPYEWGAEGPNSYDCSGLVQWAFAHAGVRMPRVSQQQWFAGPHIDYADALPGDLLFWHYDPTDRTNIDHVAIYAGNGMMLVAPHTGDYVKYVPVPLTNFAGVVRVDPGIAAQIG